MVGGCLQVPCGWGEGVKALGDTHGRVRAGAGALTQWYRSRDPGGISGIKGCSSFLVFFSFFEKQMEAFFLESPIIPCLNGGQYITIIYLVSLRNAIIVRQDCRACRNESGL